MSRGPGVPPAARPAERRGGPAWWARGLDELIAADEDLGQTARVGGWQRRTDGGGILGESWEEAPAGAGERVFRWQPLVSEAGEYEVWVRWPDVAGLASDAPYTVVHAGGT